MHIHTQLWYIFFDLHERWRQVWLSTINLDDKLKYIFYRNTFIFCLRFIEDPETWGTRQFLFHDKSMDKISIMNQLNSKLYFQKLTDVEYKLFWNTCLAIETVVVCLRINVKKSYYFNLIVSIKYKKHVNLKKNNKKIHKLMYNKILYIPTTTTEHSLGGERNTPKSALNYAVTCNSS